MARSPARRLANEAAPVPRGWRIPLVRALVCCPLASALAMRLCRTSGRSRAACTASVHPQPPPTQCLLVTQCSGCGPPSSIPSSMLIATPPAPPFGSRYLPTFEPRIWAGKLPHVSCVARHLPRLQTHLLIVGCACTTHAVAYPLQRSRAGVLTTMPHIACPRLTECADLARASLCPPHLQNHQPGRK